MIVALIFSRIRESHSRSDFGVIFNSDFAVICSARFRLPAKPLLAEQLSKIAFLCLRIIMIIGL